MADRQPKLFLLRVAFFAAFFVQVIFSQNLTSNSIEIFASNINESSVEVSFASNYTEVSNFKVSANANSFKIENLFPGMLYNITAVNSSSIVQMWTLPTRPLKPTNISENVIGTNVSIEWKFDNQASGGNKWQISYKSENETNYTALTSNTKVIQLSLKDGTKYEVKIRTLANNVTSETSLDTSFATYPNALSNATVKTNGRSIIISWVKRSSFKYIVCLTNVPDCSKKIDKGNYTFTNLVAGKSYNLSIIVHAHERNSSDYKKTIMLPPLPPTNVTVDSITTDSATINWKLENTLSLGDEWLIQYKTDSSQYKNKTSSKSIRLTSLEDGERYEVKIWTLSNKVYSESYSNTSFVTYPKAVSNINMRTNERNITVTWQTHKHFSYTVCLTNIYNCAEKKKIDTYTFTNLVAGKSYNVSITVHAYDKNSSEYTGTIILPPLPPTNVTKNLINNKLFMEWYIDSNISVASEWYIEYTTENNTKNLTTSIRNTALELESGKEYEIKIWSRSLDVKSDRYFLIPVNTAPEEVVNITVKENDSQLTLSWSPPSQSSVISHYKVGYSESCSTSQNCPPCKEVKQIMESSKFNVDGSEYTNVTSYTFSIKPGCCYSTIIWAFNDNVKGKPAYHKCRTTSFEPPVENKPDNIKLASASTESFTVTLKPNPFKETNGPIINYNIIIAIDKSMRHTHRTYLPSWKEFKNNGSIKAYQIFKKCSNLYEKSNACSNLNSKSKRSLNSPVQYSIGTENCEDVDGFCNGHLMPDTDYYIKVRAYTFDKYTDTNYSSAIRTEKEKMESYLIAIIVLIILLIIVVIIGIIVYVVKKRRTKPKAVVETDSPYNMQPTSHPVRAADFDSHFTQMSADTDYLFAEEYESLKDVGKDNQTVDAHLSSNRIKNRFVNILPYDYSRVKLSKSIDDDDEGSDYINANYIPGFNSRREYIATQGPLSSTRDDFWRMVWEQNVHNIVMLANCIEKHREKCDHYWPDNDETRCYGNIKVEKLNETITSDWTVTEFLMTNHDHVARHLHHFHFTSWPDFGVPSSPQSIVTFVRLVRKKLQNIGPLVVHCSAGVGRTGTFISVDRSLQDLEKNNVVDVLKIVHEMRQYRCFMVQTEEQYIYIHRCIQYAIKGDDKDIYANEIYMNEDIYQNMNAGHVNKAFLYGPFFHAGISWKDLQIQKFAGVPGAGISQQDAIPKANSNRIRLYFPDS